MVERILNEYAIARCSTTITGGAQHVLVQHEDSVVRVCNAVVFGVQSQDMALRL